MITRKQYLETGGEDIHKKYYAQFVGDYERSVVKDFDSIDAPLSRWDRLPVPSNRACDLMRELGDYMTLAGKVCIYKEAFRQNLEKRINDD